MKKDYYVIDLDSRKPEIELYPIDIVKEDMKYFGVNKPSKLQDNDWRVFETLDAAKAFLDDYYQALRSLPKIGEIKQPGLPPMLLKRRYLALAALGLKLQTFRDYNTGWKSGSEFYFHDQTHALKARLKSIKATAKGYCYSYSIVKA